MSEKGGAKFERVVAQFKSIYPTLSKQLKYYEPFVLPIIEIGLKDGSRMIFDERTYRASFVGKDDDLHKYL